MKVTVNYPKNPSELKTNIAMFQAILIKESIDRIDVDINSKRKILERVTESFKNK
jgi:hypothetical protein